MVAATGLAVVAVSAFADEKEKPAAGGEFKDLHAKASYSIGASIGKQLKAQSAKFDLELVIQGIKDSVAGKLRMSDDEIGGALKEFARQEAGKVEELALKNKKAGEDFLAANKKNPGVVVLPSGLQYQVLKEGSGKSPKATDTVSVHYKGTLIDGTKFDSSYDRGEPMSIPVGQVIRGWTEALQLMKVGSKWKLYIPTNLAYDANPRPGGIIKPYDPLIFEVELLDVK
jgi:FKBP-type peptidyl-prolyl cis-trans isomerase